MLIFLPEQSGFAVSDEKIQGNPSFLLGFVWICLDGVRALVEPAASRGSLAGSARFA
jgi:hypothetical protein